MNKIIKMAKSTNAPLVLITMLLMVGLVFALTSFSIVSKSNYTVSDSQVRLNVSAMDIHSYDNLALNITGPTNAICIFKANGSIVSGCTTPPITINVTGHRHYGYGGGSDDYNYSITMSVSDFNSGVYAAKINRSSYFANCTYSINKTVIDTTPPIITLLGDIAVTIPYGSSYSDAGATAYDNVDGDMTSSIITVNPVNPSIVSTYTVTYDVTDAAGNHATQVTRNVNVIRADQTITFGSLSDKTYGDADFDVSASSDSGLPVSFISSGYCTISGNTVHIIGAGTCTITAQQVGNENYNPATDVPQTFVINKATATITVTPYGATYNGDAHTATVTATGVLGEDLSGSIDLSGTTHTDAGDYTGDSWTFTDTTGNYNDDSGTVNDVINTLAISASGFVANNKVYDGTNVADIDFTSAGLTGTVSGDVVSLDYSAASGSFDDANAGNGKSVTISGLTLTGTDAGNYALSPSVYYTTADITKATATVTLSDLVHTYDGTSKAATSSTAPTGLGVDVAYDGSSANPIGAGTYTVVATINDANYQGTSTDMLTISKADRTCTLDTDKGWSRTFDNTASSTSCSVSAGSDDGLMAFTKDSVDVSSPDSQTNAGTFDYSCQWTGGSNYNDCTQQTGTLTISKADATIIVSGYTGTYDAASHGASGTATGVLSEDLSSQLDLGLSYTNYPGGTAYWVFTGGTNYNDQNGDVSIDISKADATIVVTLYDVTYNGIAHTAAYTAKGVLGEDLAGMDVSSTTHTDAGDYTGDSWTFTDTTGNYNDDSGTVNDNIGKADQTITFGSLSDKTYGDADFDISASSDSGLHVSFIADSGLTITTVASGDCTVSGATVHIIGAGTCTIIAQQAGDSNYNVAHDVYQTFSIAKKPITVTADAQSKVYGDADPIFTYTSDALIGTDSLTGSLERDVGENVGTYAINQGTLTAGSNYIITYVSDDLTVTQKPITVTADAKSKVYGNADPALTYASDALVGTDSFTGELNRISGESVGTYTINQNNLTAGSNYIITYVPAVLTITSVPVTPSYSGGGSGFVSNCSASWVCSGWSACVNGVQTRTCSNSVPACTTPASPATTQACGTTTTSASTTTTVPGVTTTVSGNPTGTTTTTVANGGPTGAATGAGSPTGDFIAALISNGYAISAALILALLAIAYLILRRYGFELGSLFGKK